MLNEIKVSDEGVAADIDAPEGAVLSEGINVAGTPAAFVQGAVTACAFIGGIAAGVTLGEAID